MGKRIFHEDPTAPIYDSATASPPENQARMEGSICEETAEYLIQLSEFIAARADSGTDGQEPTFELNAGELDNVRVLQEAALGHELRCRANHGAQVTNVMVDALTETILPDLLAELMEHGSLRLPVRVGVREPGRRGPRRTLRGR